ncbi:methyltransferase OMS1 [Colletotrichum sublineola]|nr:methyltransferase OMS1 [Colletotrichum sublineola]
MLHVATRAKCPRLPQSLFQILQRPASTRPARQTAKPSRLTNLPKSYLPRRAHPVSIPSPTSPAALETAETIFRARKVPLLASGVVALGLGIYLSLLASSVYSSSCCQCPEPTQDAIPTGRPGVFTKESARKFDQSLDGSEWLMGVTALRQKMATEASGHVLEVAIGTGRNLPFYDWSNILQPQSTSSMKSEPKVANTEGKRLDPSSSPILSYTGVDISSEMLGVAIEKLIETVPQLAGVAPRALKQDLPTQGDWGVFSYLSDRLRIFRSDIHNYIPPPPEQMSTMSKYDFVCSTFSLCSVRDPEQIVRDLANMVKPGTGRIILVEHGRGWSGFVNGLLDKSAASHFKKYGCWWNRDIAEIVESASNSVPGLEVVKVERPYFTQLGTTLWVELRVSRTS